MSETYSDFELKVLRIVQRKQSISASGIMNHVHRKVHSRSTVDYTLAHLVEVKALQVTTGQFGAVRYSLVDPYMDLGQETPEEDAHNGYLTAGECVNCGAAKKLNKSGLCAACNVKVAKLDLKTLSRIDEIVKRAQQAGGRPRARAEHDLRGKKL